MVASPEVLTQRRLKTQEKASKKASFEEILEVSKRRGEVWLFPMRWATQNSLPIGIWGIHFGQFLFEAVSTECVKKLEQEGVKILEGREDMIVRSRRVTIKNVEAKLKTFIKTHYPEFTNLDICFVDDTRILFHPKFSGPPLYAASRKIE